MFGVGGTLETEAKDMVSLSEVSTLIEGRRKFLFLVLINRVFRVKHWP